MPLHTPSRFLAHAFGSVILSLVFLTASPAQVQAQHLEIDELAARLAEAIARSGAKKVVVFDLAGPDGKPLPLGTWLADQLSTSLANLAKNLDVLNRSRLKAVREQNGLVLKSELHSNEAILIGRSLGADAVILGDVGGLEDGLGVSMVVFRVSEKSKKIELLFATRGRLSLTGPMRELLQHPLQPLPVYKAGLDGVSFPHCIQCRGPELAPQDFDRSKRRPSVLLDVVVAPDGSVTGVVVVKSLDVKLENRAIEAVRQWRLKPATNAEGKPVPVRILVDLNFKLK